MSDASPTIADTDVDHFRGDTWGRIRASFHRRRDCVRIRDAADLREVDKPYDATRCSHCARD